MPLEMSKGDKGDFSTPAATPAAASPADDRVAKLEAELAATKQKYDIDMAAVAEWAKTLAAPVVDPSHTTDPEPADTDLVDHASMKKQFTKLQGELKDALVQVSSHTARQTREANKEILRGKLENFDRYEKEVDGLLDKMNPLAAASPDTIRKVYSLVRSQHVEEEKTEYEKSFDARVKERLREELAARGIEDEEEEAELSPPSASVSPASGTEVSGSGGKPVISAGIAPSGDASATRPRVRRSEQTPALTREEREFAKIFGIESADEYRQYQRDDYGMTFDAHGFHGKDRI